MSRFWLLTMLGVSLLVWGVAFAWPTVRPVEYVATSVAAERADETTTRTVAAPVPLPPPDTRPRVQHIPQPPAVKAIYMSACVAGTPSFRTELVSLIERTELNSVMIDIKDYSGTVSFPIEDPLWRPAWEQAGCGARDMAAFIADLHTRGIYVIGRITVFQDPLAATRFPHLAVKRRDGETIWRDGKGLAFIDVAASEYWEQVVRLAAASYAIGFDELNFDYVRYPSDGNMTDIMFPHTAAGAWPQDKAANLEAFFSYLHATLTATSTFAVVRHEGTGRAVATPWLSADLFGMTTTNTDDLSIGQLQERAIPYFDVLAPMVYPSHYPPQYLGLADPNDHPYTIVHHAMTSAVARAAATTTSVAGFLHTKIGTTTPSRYTKPTQTADHFRTWIQDFDYGGDYDATDVRAQIQASYDAGVKGWMLWAPSNRYTEAALLAATSSVQEVDSAP